MLPPQPSPVLQRFLQLLRPPCLQPPPFPPLQPFPQRRPFRDKPPQPQPPPPPLQLKDRPPNDGASLLHSAQRRARRTRCHRGQRPRLLQVMRCSPPHLLNESRYFRMLKMGVPKDVLRMKMSAENINPDVIE